MVRLHLLSRIVIAALFLGALPRISAAAETATYAPISRQVAEAEIAHQRRISNPKGPRDSAAESRTNLRIFVSAAGKVDKVEVAGPSNSRAAADATAAAIMRSWRFEFPFTIDHHPHAVVFELPLSFVLAAKSAWRDPPTPGGLIHMVIQTDARGVGASVEFLNKVDPQVQESIRTQVIGHFHGIPNHAYRKSLRYDRIKKKS